jgi:hypothetical protein
MMRKTETRDGPQTTAKDVYIMCAFPTAMNEHDKSPSSRKLLCHIDVLVVLRCDRVESESGGVERRHSTGKCVQAFPVCV